MLELRVELRMLEKTFCHFIDQSKREQLTEAQVFSILINGSTDTGNIDDEMFLVFWCDTDCDDELVHYNMSYFAVGRPKQVDRQRLFDCL